MNVSTTTISLEKAIVAEISWLHSNIFVPILFVVAVFASAGNTLLLFVMIKNKNFRQVYSNWLMIFLSFADMIYGKEGGRKGALALDQGWFDYV